MQTLQISTQILTTTSHIKPKTLLKPKPEPHFLPITGTGTGKRRRSRFLKAFPSEEFPVDETWLEKYAPKDKETEDEARKSNWVDRGWAPWEEILSPEAHFATHSLNEGEEVPLKTPQAIEAFKMLKPSYRKKKMEELGLTQDEWDAKQFDIQGEIMEPLETTWDGPLVVQPIAPRDWPPRGWEVDRKELEFIREGHKMMAEGVKIEEVEGALKEGGEDMALDRYKVFLKQYQEWVEHNKDRLEEESYKHDQDYHPGRRKRGKDYKEGMYELPFYYPGQICVGKVTTLHLYQGAFIDVGGVYDGWVPIKGNDWYWLRQHIKVGMHVMVEVLAKRDPYRFRFPLELRLVDPNIDHLIFNRFDYAPIFHRDEDTPEELRLDCRRPPIPRKDPGIKIEEESLLSNHPYVYKLWQINVAEQTILDDMEANPDKYKGKKLSELTDDEEFDEQNSIEHSEVSHKNSLLPKVTMKTSVKELDLESAFAERQHHNKLEKEAKERGEEYEIDKLRRNIEMDEYDFIHWRRSFEEREALLRDISCRQAVGLPLQEPGRYVDPEILGKGEYDPSNPLYRYDYWGEPKNSEKSKEDRLAEAHNKSIVGKGQVWYSMSYEEAIEQMKQRKANSKNNVEKEPNEVETRPGNEEEEEDDDSDLEFDFSVLSDPDIENATQPHVNGTESSSISDEGMFED